MVPLRLGLHSHECIHSFIHMVNSFLVYCNSRSLVTLCLSLYDTPCHLRTLLTRNDSTKDRTLNFADSGAAVYCQHFSVEDKYPKIPPSPSML